MRNMAWLIEQKWSKFGVIIDRAALISLSIVLRCSLFLLLILVGVENPNSFKYVVVNDKSIAIARFESRG